MSSNSGPLFQKVLWSVDAFSGSEITGPSAKSLRALANRQEISVEPATVLSPATLRLAPEFFKRLVAEQSAIALRNTESIAAASGLPCSRPKVLTEDKRSTRAAVQRLLTHAQAVNADLIVATTHARRGLERLVAGSFAESLLTHSPIPVLLTNPSAKTPEQFERILFATDLAPESRAELGRVIDLAKSLKARLTLYHQIPANFDPVLKTAQEFPIVYPELIESVRQQGEEWVRQARNAGVTTEFKLDESNASTGEAIATYAESSKQDLAIIVTQAGPMETIFLGSNSRALARSSRCPVLILRSKTE